MSLEFHAAVVTFIITIIFGALTIPILEKLKFGQMVRYDGPQRHLKKRGTPTMGGIFFISSIAISSLVLSRRSAKVVVAVIFMLGFSFIGLFDDYLKIIKKRSLGLRANQKLIGQLILALGLSIYAYTHYPGTGILNTPFLETGLNLGIWYIPFNIFVILGTVNSANITDGLDGLATGIFVIISFFYTLISIALGMKELAIFSSALSGGCLGFLIYNYHPAKVFMGDTGSLGLGGALATIAVLTNTQIYLAFFAMTLVVETLSVILQVIFFKITGRRIFKMSPIHHHFELKGWKESKVVIVFWGVTLITCLLGFIVFYKTGF